tara:strand:+ start:621 stop:1652 length:1032 start_codon:yes stop_codon:yes gene_type:complete
MGGGLMQLVAMGAQDVYLTGNPQITFFKVVYRRHTNFSKEAIKQEWNGSGTTKTCTLARNGDLVQEIYLFGADGSQVTPTTVEIEIGGQKIDKHYNAWLDIYDELFESNHALKNAIDTHYMPLRFWFNRNPGLALPLIALQYHEVKVSAEWDSATNAAHCDSLLVNYLYLDTDERRRFAQVSHEYLIEQVQHTGEETLGGAGSKSITLTFNHPVKALFWKKGSGDDLSTFTAKLQLNGHDRASEQGHKYFTGVQPYECGLKTVGCENNTTVTAASSAMYSFCLKPAEHQPSGTCNFSRIDNARLVLSGLTYGANNNNTTLNVFAMNYNVLRIMSGMGGLAYSN